MTDSDWTVLVPVEILEGETIPESIIDLLSPLPVVVLGYHVLPEQTPPGQARMQYEEQAQSKLDELADAFGDTGGPSKTRLVFTHDEEQTMDRVADETGCNAILVPNPARQVERLFVPVGGDVDVARISAFVVAMIGDRDIEVTLFHVADDEAEESAGQSMVEDTATQLREYGLPATAIETEVVVSKTPIKTIGTAAADYDAVVMGESEPSLQSLLFGETSEQVAAKSLGPVIVVRRPRDAEASESDSESEPESGSKSEPEPEPGSKPDPDPEPEPGSKPDPDPESESGSKSESKPE